MTTDTDTLVALATQITPGPWKATIGESYLAVGSDDFVIYEIEITDLSDRSVNCSNARAIALVPELLAEVIANRARIEALEAEVARLTRHAEAGWDQQRYWSGRYEESAKIRDAMDAQLTEAQAGEGELVAALREIEAHDDGTIDLHSPQELASRALASHDKRKEGRNG